jgi:hypothetical protein
VFLPKKTLSYSLRDFASLICENSNFFAT